MLYKDASPQKIDMLIVISTIAARARLATDKETMDVSYVQSCLVVHDKLCQNRKVCAVLQELEGIYGLKSCLNSVGL
jgi:hypothetical protein